MWTICTDIRSSDPWVICLTLGWRHTHWDTIRFSIGSNNKATMVKHLVFYTKYSEIANIVFYFFSFSTTTANNCQIRWLLAKSKLSLGAKENCTRSVQNLIILLCKVMIDGLVAYSDLTIIMRLLTRTVHKTELSCWFHVSGGPASTKRLTNVG